MTNCAVLLCSWSVQLKRKSKVRETFPVGPLHGMIYDSHWYRLMCRYAAHLCAVLPLVVDHHPLTVHLGGAPGLVVGCFGRGAGLVGDALEGEGEHTGAALLSLAS